MRVPEPAHCAEASAACITDRSVGRATGAGATNGELVLRCTVLWAAVRWCPLPSHDDGPFTDRTYPQVDRIGLFYIPLRPGTAIGCGILVEAFSRGFGGQAASLPV